jgi:hypothetical protein
LKTKLPNDKLPNSEVSLTSSMIRGDSGLKNEIPASLFRDLPNSPGNGTWGEVVLFGQTPKSHLTSMMKKKD